MPTGKITKRAIDSLSPDAKVLFLWDEELRGFGLKLTPNGAKSYVVQYRLGGREAKTRRFTIGTHGSPWTPEQARTEAKRLLTMVGQGTDPQAAAQERRRVAVDLALKSYVERFLEEYGEQNWRKDTLSGAAGNLRRYLVPVLGDKPLPSIKRSDITAVLDAIPPSKPALRRGVFANVRKLFSWAVERGDIERSPFEGMKPPAVVASRDRILSDDELRLVWDASTDLGKLFGPLVRLLLLTGQRRDEVGGMTWRELNRSAAEWVIPAARSKNGKAHVVPLSAPALAELDAIAGKETWPTRGFVFSTTKTTPISGYSKVKARLDRKMLELSGAEDLQAWRLHDLRRTFATGMQRLGIRFEVTEALLNHVSGSRAGVAGIYQRHDWREEKRAALDAWARHVEQLVSGSEDTNVVELRRELAPA